MSRLYSPYPPAMRDLEKEAASGAIWWRIPLDGRDHEDHYLTVTRAGEHALCLEWFDGHNIALDLGLDKPNVMACGVNEHGGEEPYLLMLAVTAPTPEAEAIDREYELGHTFNPVSRKAFGDPTRAVGT